MCRHPKQAREGGRAAHGTSVCLHTLSASALLPSDPRRMEPQSTGGHCSGEPFRYEGAEKTLEMHFSGPGLGLRALPRHVWDQVLDHACCRILSKTSTTSLDAYVLSESSLFVYDWRIYLKTCGRTTLLKCLPPLINAVENYLGASADWLRFSHKNFAFPEDQKFPHSSFEQETHFCLSYCSSSVSSAHMLGDILDDHWNVLYLDLRNGGFNLRSPSPVSLASISSDSITTRCSTARLEGCEDDLLRENIVNVMMYDMERTVAEHFHPRIGEETGTAGRRATVESGIADLFDKDAGQLTFDSYMFTPCGYSLNVLIGGEFYATIHVTPEADFSYASFETNLPTRSYETLLRKVLDVFRPERCTVALFSDCKRDECLTLANGEGRRTVYKRVSHGSARIQNVFFAEMSSFSRFEE